MMLHRVASAYTSANGNPSRLGQREHVRERFGIEGELEDEPSARQEQVLELVVLPSALAIHGLEHEPPLEPFRAVVLSLIHI